VAVEHQQATYLVQWDPDVPRSVEVAIYDAVSVNPGLRFEQSVLIFSLPEDGVQALMVTEIHSVVNPSDRTFLPSADGPGGPEGLLVFPLPPNAGDLRPLMGLDPSRLVQIGRGFASLAQVVPGRSEISFSYRMPYNGDAIRIDRTIRYPVATLRLLAPRTGPELASDQFPTRGEVTVAGRQYARLEAGPLAVGTAISVTASALPLPGGLLARIPPPAVAAAGIFCALLLLALYLARSRTGDDAGSAEPAEEWLEEALQLDIDRQAGRISDVEYQGARAALLDRVRRGTEGGEDKPDTAG
jgi:hypothetical protein